MKGVTSVQHVIIAIILHNHPGTEGAQVLSKAVRACYSTRLAERRGRRGFHSITAAGEPQSLFQVELSTGMM